MNKPIHTALDHLEKNFATYIEQLSQLVSIPSISFDGYPREPLNSSAQAVADLLTHSGLQNVEILELEGVFPYVYAEHISDPTFPTVLLYAHHDVQPPMREEIWNTPPFTAVEKDGRLYGRGTADDKAGILVHAASMHALIKTGSDLKVNVKILIEGEEEIGSPHLSQFIEAYKERLTADAIVITDATNYDTGLPTLTTCLRGMVCMEIEVAALKSPLHSGLWGGPIPDPIMGLSKIIASLTNDDGTIAIPEIYTDLPKPTEAELESYQRLGMTDSLFREQAGIIDGVALHAHDTNILTSMWKQPSLIVNSIESGNRKTAGNVIMDSAWARIGVRLPAGISSQRVEELLDAKITQLCPWGLTLSITKEAAVDGWSTDTTSPIFDQALKALSDGYGAEAVYAGCGASIPLADELSSALGGVPTLLMGIEDPYTNAHSENESLDLNDFKKAIKSQILFLQRF